MDAPLNTVAAIEKIRRRLTARAMGALFGADNPELCGAGDLTRATVGRILICRPNHRLGNLLLITPLLQEIGRLLPDAIVDVLAAGDAATGVFAAFGNVGHVYRLSQRVARHPLQTARVALRIRRARYDLAIDPCEASQSSRLFLRLAHARYSIGSARGKPPRVAPADGGIGGPPRHMAHLPVWLLRRAVLGSECANERRYPPPSIRLSPDERGHAQASLDHLLGSNGSRVQLPVIGIFVEATGGKKYPRDWWKGFIDAFRTSEPHCILVEILPPDGEPRLATHLPTFSSPNPRAVAAIISCMTGFVSADCGVMHLASASGAPTLGLFSTSNPAKYRPYGRRDLAVAALGKSPGDVARLAHVWLRGILVDAPQDPARVSAAIAPPPRSQHKAMGGICPLQASAAP